MQSLANDLTTVMHTTKVPWMIAWHLHDRFGWGYRPRGEKLVSHATIAQWLRDHCDMSERAAHMAADDFFDRFDVRGKS